MQGWATHPRMSHRRRRKSFGVGARGEVVKLDQALKAGAGAAAATVESILNEKQDKQSQK